MENRTKEDYEQSARDGEFTDQAMEDVLNERIRQVAQCKHGGDTNIFDQKNTRNDWVAYISAYLGRAADKCARNERDVQNFRENMVKVAALAVAAIEAHDKKWC